ncbi:Crp/Fnr family transcriptional regulator [Streptomyces sp. NBC_00637]|uniref:Crp/Fnr family transcriptional regulator n=1 Tax=Streptomyces sp. NBC_00637 TaxID=2903667 RepID=UPI002F90D958
MHQGGGVVDAVAHHRHPPLSGLEVADNGGLVDGVDLGVHLIDADRRGGVGGGALGTIFGEMALLGQRMYDNFAEALDDVTVCVMSRTDVHQVLLSDARIAARITEILGVFKSVPQRLATTLASRTDTPAGKFRPGTRHPQITLTHEQLAALAGTSRETTTKVLHEFADRGLLRLARGRVTVLDPARLLDEAG